MVRVSLRTFIAAVGVLVALAGVIAMMLPMSAAETGPFGDTYEADCGSAIATATGAPSLACDDEVNGRRAWAVPLLAVGLIAAIGAYVVTSPGRRLEDAETEASATS